MDVLYGSIDIRDLLSSTNLDDPSTPLSAPDLHLLIDRLQVHSVRIKSKVHDYIRSHQSDFLSLFTQCSDVAAKTEELSAELVCLHSVLSDNPVDANIKFTIEDIVGKRKELREKKELFELLGLILELCEKLRVVKDGIQQGRVEEAAAALSELKIAFRVDDDQGESGLLVYDILRKEWTDCFDEMQDTLVISMDQAVRFEPESNSIRVKSWFKMNGSNKMELYTVLKAMDTVGVLDYGLARVADMMIKHVVSPAIGRRACITVVDGVAEDDQKTTETVLNVVSSTHDTADALDSERIFSALLIIVEFINKSICCQNGHWMRCFGRLTWPRMSELIISNFLSKVVPDDASKFADFQKIIKLSTDFEAALEELMFISSSDSKDKRLSEFVDNVEIHFAARKKVELLANARSMLLHSGFSLPPDYRKVSSSLKMEETAEDHADNLVNLLFTSEKCIVSEAALKLMELVHKALRDVCLSSPRVGLEFYHAARDALLLYEAVIPVKLEKELDTINQGAVLIHNDCLYLSQEILGLAFEYRPDFPNPIKEHAVFADLAPRFQLMAEQILDRQIQVVIFNLNQAIDGADGFQNTHLTKQYESAKFSIDQVAFILEKVHIIWEPLLMPSSYKKSMCMVLEVVFSKIAKDILNLDDMAAEETLQLQRLIHLLFENLSPILESLPIIEQSGKSEGALARSVDELIPSLRKLRKLEDLLDMPLKSITADWESGELISCGFTSTEVEDFIRAIFTDSPLRKECLFRIESSGL
ncbi:OLC1v1024611C3 [Oldenlandia corymbosa var. corymbosa]|uniref:OLC1v1024611C3 n=1 Tax=Oldenlandia corymbosa var. corymbosa TaxID=529605 RepID=A0AAV1C5U3_OLDCO|nr:OLC1v1024611C3 [Oldenlandia corymbosa var. corymbosa]